MHLFLLLECWFSKIFKSFKKIKFRIKELIQQFSSVQKNDQNIIEK